MLSVSLALSKLRNWGNQLSSACSTMCDANKDYVAILSPSYIVGPSYIMGFVAICEFSFLGTQMRHQR